MRKLDPRPPVLAVVLLLALGGCGAVMCSFTGNAIGHCPGLKQAAAQQQQGGGEEAAPEAASEEPTASASPSQSSAPESSASSSTPAPAGESCKGDGAPVNSYHECCGGKTRLARKDENNTMTVCCSGGANCS